jgi:hypothetical protein
MVAERSERHEPTIRPSEARAVALSGTHRDEWEHLPARDQALLTGEVLSRWTVALDDDEYSLAEVVRLERQRRASLATLRQGVALTDREFAIVRLLQRHEGRTVTFVEMIRTLWPDETRRASARDLWDRNGSFARHVRSMHVVLHLLRQKLEVDPCGHSTSSRYARSGTAGTASRRRPMTARTTRLARTTPGRSATRFAGIAASCRRRASRADGSAPGRTTPTMRGRRGAGHRAPLTRAGLIEAMTATRRPPASPSAGCICSRRRRRARQDLLRSQRAERHLARPRRACDLRLVHALRLGGAVD